MLESLARHRLSASDVVGASSDPQEQQARANSVLRRSIYKMQDKHLQLFDFYILDKLEVCMGRRVVLDERHYADDLKIRYRQSTRELSLLRMLPPDAWSSNSIGSILLADGGCAHSASGYLTRHLCGGN